MKDIEFKKLVSKTTLESNCDTDHENQSYYELRQTYLNRNQMASKAIISLLY